MTVLLGLIVIGLAACIGAIAYGAVTDHDNFFNAGMVGIVGGLVILLAGLGLALMLGFGGGPTIMEGACYRAVRHTVNTVIPVSTGKAVILIPSTTSGVDLEEIRCPGG